MAWGKRSFEPVVLAADTEGRHRDCPSEDRTHSQAAMLITSLTVSTSVREGHDSYHTW